MSDVKKQRISKLKNKILGGFFMATSLLPLSQKAHGAESSENIKDAKQHITEKTVDGKESSEIIRENGKTFFTHTIDLGNGYSIIESSFSASDKNKTTKHNNSRILKEPNGNTVDLNFLDINSFISPVSSVNKQKPDGNTSENFDNQTSRHQAEKTNSEILTKMKKQIDNKMNTEAAEHVYVYVQKLSQEALNTTEKKLKSSYVSSKMSVRR